MLETDPVRSALMRRVRRTHTDAEEAVGKVLRQLGVSYRRNVRSLPGSPDFANKTQKWAIFVMGCFWHHHTACPKATLPKRNHAFWRSKFAQNRHRDASKIRALRRQRYKVFVIWRCEVVSGITTIKLPHKNHLR